MNVGLIRGEIVMRKMLLFTLVLGFSLSLFANPKPARKATSRGPAAASKACPDYGCACNDLKAFANSCQIENHAQYTRLAQSLRAEQDERRKTELKSCPFQAAAETCRAKSKKSVTQKKSRHSMYKISATQELGNFGIELLESTQKTPRSPASR